MGPGETVASVASVVRARLVALVVLSIVTVALVARAAWAETPDDLVKQGLELRKQGDDEGALREFNKAYAISATPRVTAQIALAEQALGRWADADQHLTLALRSADDPWIQRNRKSLDEAAAIIKQHLARVEVAAEPPGAEVLVNARRIGRAPLPAPIVVSAGEVTVEVRAPGHKPKSHMVRLVGGQYQVVVIRLDELAEGVAPEPPAETTASGVAADSSLGQPADQPPPAGSPELRPVLKWTALGLAGAGIVTGVVATLVHGSRLSAFNNGHDMTCVESGGTAVHRVDGTPAPECQGDLDGIKRAQTWAIVGFVAGGVFAATWAVLALTEPSGVASAGTSTTARGEQGGWTCLPVLAATGPRAACTLRF